eukprot:g8457.t2
MSLKDAVSALRSLKAELEASRTAKAELENAYRGVREELRIAKETQQHQPGTGSEHSHCNNGHPGGDEDDEPPQETEATAKRELQEAIGTSERARAAAEAAEDKLAKEHDRAEAAERELAGAVDDAALLRTRLDETCEELESTRDALALSKAAGVTSRSEEEGEDAAELENELRSVREAVAGEAPSSSQSIETQGAGSSAASLAALQDAATAADERANRLQDELASASREIAEMRESTESDERSEEEESKRRLAQESEAAAAAAASLAEATSRLAEKEEEVEGLTKRLAEVEEAAEGAKEEAARDKASGDENAAALAAALEEATEKIASLGEKLSTNMEALDKTRRLAASDEEKRDEEVSSLRRELDMMGEELGRATALASASEARAEQERTAAVEALPRIEELEASLRKVEEDRTSLLEAAATEATRLDEERAANLAEKETAEEKVREAEARASAAEAAVVRVKSKVAVLKERLSQAEKDTNVAVDEKEAAEAARKEAEDKRQGVEETLLMANKELQRLKLKGDEALSESENLREECNRLSAALEALRAEKAEQADGNKDREEETQAEEPESPGVEEAREEIARLRKTIEEMKLTRDEVDVSGSDADGRGGRDERDQGEEQDRGEGDEAEGRHQLIKERDSLRAELGEEKRKSAVRVAGLETQLADKEREAADTQRRLYLRQSELETELEDLNAHHDALRVEMARMDASMQDAADASLASSSSSSGRAGGGAAAGRKSAGRDPAAIGAEMGGAVGGVLRGRLWSGWRGGGGGPADTEEGASGRVRGQAGEGASKKSKARGAGGTQPGAVAGGGDATQESINRVRENMMARLQDAASQPGGSRDGRGDEGGDLVRNKKGVFSDDEGGRNGNGTGTGPGVPSVGHGAAVGVAEDEWVEETVEHPAPDYGVDSPVIRYLLQQWSGEPEKLRYLSLWLRCVIERRKVPDAFPSGLQLVGLAPEVKDGFLTLVIPMIRFNGGVPVLVHSRRCPPDEHLSMGDGAPGASDSRDTELKLPVLSWSVETGIAREVMGSTRSAASLFFGAVIAATCGIPVSAMETIEIIVPLYQYPGGLGWEGSLWEEVRSEALKTPPRPMTGIVNPFNGPRVDESPNPDDYPNYQYMLHEYLGKGTQATEASAATARHPTDANPTDGNAQRALQTDGVPNLTLICYVSTDYGARDPLEVEADIERYEELFPGVCDGIFLDETSADISYNPTLGVLYERYSNHVLAQNEAWTITFNTGSAVDPEFYNRTRFKNNPTMMSYENFYRVMKNVGIPLPTPSSGGLGERSQHAMLVHTADLDDVIDVPLIDSIVSMAYCAGWGKIYLTDDVLPNQWDREPAFWDVLVDAVYSDHTTGACPHQQTPTLMVPLYLDSSPDVEAVTAVVSKSDYLEKEAVWVIVEAEDTATTTLSDAGARTKIPRCTLVVKYSDPDATLQFNPYAKDFREVSLQGGPVIVAREVDASGPFELPDIPGATRQNSALIVSGFTATDTQTVECVLNEVGEVFDYTYVMGDATSTAYLADLHAEIEAPAAPDCVPATPAPTPGPTPDPTSTTSCAEDEAEAMMTWRSGSRKILITGGGCADMTRIKDFLDGKNFVDDHPLIEMGGGVWELDASIDVRADTVVRIIGEVGGGECNELRLLTDATNNRRPRVLGNEGSIEILHTKVVGWIRGTGEVDENSNAARGYIYCSSCGLTPTGQCVMSVKNSKIWHLGSGGVNSGGLAWRDRCSSKADAIADEVEILGNRRGVYAHGSVLKFDNVEITGSAAESIRVDTTSGYVKTSTVNQGSSSWPIHVHRPAGLEIADNVVTGSRNLFVGTPGSSSPTLAITGNAFEASSAIRIGTPDTLFQDNSGDGNTRVQKEGCFAEESTSADTGVQAYIEGKTC